MQFTETMLPTFERATGEKPFDMTPFMRFLHRNLVALRPMLKARVDIGSRCTGIRASRA